MTTGIESICIHLLGACNLSCRHCWSYSNSENREALDYEDLVHILLKLKAGGLQHISLSGGEPFLYNNLNELAEVLLSNGLTVTITTNGTLRNKIEEFLQILAKKELLSSNLLRIRVSLDGDEASHDQVRGKGTYHKAIATTKYLKAKLGYVGINSVASKLLCSRIEPLSIVLKELKVDDWAILTETPTVGCDDLEGQILDAIREFDCCIDMIGSSCYTGDILRWDYLRLHHVGIILDYDGVFKLMGRTPSEHLEIGHYQIEGIVKEMNDMVFRIRSTTLKSYFGLEGYYNAKIHRSYPSSSGLPSADDL